MAPFIDSIRSVARRCSSQSSGCSHLRVPPTMVTLDAHGDMMLLVGKQKCIHESCNDERQNRQPNAICFRLNSAIIAGASPAFGLALYSPSAETTRHDGVKWTVNLPDDDPQAMQTIITILYGHYPVSSFDKHMEIEQLLQLTVVADKYDLVHLFPKWSAQWLRDMERYWVDRTFVRQSTEDLESLLWIFWVLGHEPLYTYMVLQIAFYSELDAAGKLTDPAEQLCFTNEFREVPLPPCAPFEIGLARIEVLKIIRRDIKQTIEEHLHGRQQGQAQSSRCRRADGENDAGWRQSVLASLLEMLRAEGIWPVPPADRLTASPRSLVEIFRVNPNIPAFAHHHHGKGEGEGDGGRSSCDADGPFWARVEALLHEARFALSAAAAGHLSEQAAKSGLAGYFASKDLGVHLRPDKGCWSLKDILAFQAAVSRAAADKDQQPRWI
ncbi:hypothetical protein F5Y14DRAFT_438159 [Nemania sp. NC0429]|nr:hypothetical protein F5Y14DRAFT_438159 [Nemania sp. NC0429]